MDCIERSETEGFQAPRILEDSIGDSHELESCQYIPGLTEKLVSKRKHCPTDLSRSETATHKRLATLQEPRQRRGFWFNRNQLDYRRRVDIPD
jgi:hypothetical protein